jgi:hypothetical protein
MKQRVLVDGHVHLHSCFDAAVFLDAAAANFRQAANRTGVAADAPGFLLLTETPDARAFEGLRDGLLPVGAGWEIRAAAETESLLAYRHGRLCLVIVAGTQIRTTDSLEVLALLTDYRFSTSLALDSAVAEVQRVGGIPVVPWGFGKWTLQRRRTVAAAMESAPRPFFLGDNGGRPRLGPMPKLLRRASLERIAVLPGSDPLPFPGQQTRAGSFGFIAILDTDDPQPAAALREWLLALKTQPATYGKGERLVSFIGNQLRMQLRMRLRR